MQTVTPFERGENYYLDARREWRDRYGEFIHAAAVWRTVAVVSLLIALFSVGICGYLSVRTRFIPYVIELGKDGTPVVTGFAKEASSSDERVIKALLTIFITDLRSVVSDVSAQKASVERLFHFIRASDPSHQLLIEHFQNNQNDPFERVASETVSVQVTSLLPVTKDTWQVEWIETVRSRAGGEKEKVSQKAMVTVDVVSPHTEELIRHNPIGLFVKDLRWAKVL
jgi:type IV secretory pathway TrbF-like protein